MRSRRLDGGLCEDAVDVGGDPGLATGESQQVGVGADAVGRAGPDGVQDIVKELAALLDGEACSAGSQPCAARRAVAKALKGHWDWAVRTEAPPATCRAGSGMRLKSSNGDGEWVRGERRRQVDRDGLRCGGELCDEARGAGFGAFDLPGVAEVDLRSGGEQAGVMAWASPNRAAGWRGAWRLRAGLQAAAAGGLCRRRARRFRLRRGTRRRRQ